MGLFDFSTTRKLIELQNLVRSGGSDKLVMSEKAIYNNAYRIAANCLKIMNESAQLVNNTVKPDVFFKRYSILIEHGEKLVKFEPYLKFDGESPSVTLRKIRQQRHQATLDFLERAYKEVSVKAAAMKTEKGTVNQFIKFFDSLDAFYDEMDGEAQEYIFNLEKNHNRT